MGYRLLQQYEGSCHCGAVRFVTETDFPELTTCDCSICRRKNALMVKVHESKFTLLAGEDSITEYQFHTRTARLFFAEFAAFTPFIASASPPTMWELTCIVCTTSILQAYPFVKP